MRLGFLVVTAAALSLAAYGPEAPPDVPKCSARGALPDPTCTPGDVATTDVDAICGGRPRERSVSEATRLELFSAYGIRLPQPPGAFEIDHLISLELGGSNEISNLWPQAGEPRPGFREKDRVESYLHREVCAGHTSLEAAQRVIAEDWRKITVP
jgi:hypothetical protein